MEVVPRGSLRHTPSAKRRLESDKVLPGPSLPSEVRGCVRNGDEPIGPNWGGRRGCLTSVSNPTRARQSLTRPCPGETVEALGKRGVSLGPRGRWLASGRSVPRRSYVRPQAASSSVVAVGVPCVPSEPDRLADPNADGGGTSMARWGCLSGRSSTSTLWSRVRIPGV